MQMMWQKFKAFFGDTATLLITLGVIYFGVLSVRAVVENNRVNTRISQLESEIAQIKVANHGLEVYLKYLQTDVFKELEARRRLALKAPDEHVLAVPLPTTSAPTEARSVVPQKNSALPSASNFNRWWQWVIGK